MIFVKFVPYQWPSHLGGKGQSATPDNEKIAKNRENSGKIGKKSGKIGEKEEKSGRKGKNREVSFPLPLLTDRASYATVPYPLLSYSLISL